MFLLALKKRISVNCQFQNASFTADSVFTGQPHNSIHSSVIGLHLYCVHTRQGVQISFLHNAQIYSMQIFLFHNLAAFEFDPAASPTVFSKQQGKLHNNFSNTEELQRSISTLQNFFFIPPGRWPTIAPSLPPPTTTLSETTAATLSSA